MSPVHPIQKYHYFSYICPVPTEKHKNNIFTNSYMKSFLKTLLAAFVGSLVALFVCGFFFFIIIGSLAALTDEKTPEVPSSAILKIDFSQPITEQSTDNPLAGFSLANPQIASRTLGILPAVRAIEKAATDPAIRLIYLNPQNMNIGIAQLEEMRNALMEFRKSGKPVIAYSDNYSQGSYYLASVADKVYIHKDGTALLSGLGSNIMFFKGLLDKLGIQVQLIRHGKFKAAAEQFITSTISKENREQNQVMLDAIWGTWLSAIGESRDIDPAHLNELVDDLQLGMAPSLIQNGLVDQAFTRDEMIGQLCTLFEVEKEKDLRMITLSDYIKATATTDFKTKDKIAVIYATGEITMDGDELSAKKYAPLIAQVRKDSTIKGVVLRVNSPGGDAQAAEIINNELQLLRTVKPLIVSFGDYAASGGYWISAQGDRIFTDKTTLTGSIGVFSLFLNYGKGLKEHLDINSVSINTNRHTDMFSGLRPMDEKEQDYMRNFVETIYGRFTELVSTGRDLPLAYVDSIGQGRVWAGSDALKIKLADEAGGLRDAILYTASRLNLEKFRLLEFPVQKTYMEKLLSSLSDAENNVRTLTDPAAMIEKTYSELRQFNGLKTFARLPYIYDFQY